MRGRWTEALGWNASVYRTDLNDDIIFISSGGAVNAGFFQLILQAQLVVLTSATAPPVPPSCAVLIGFAPFSPQNLPT